MRPLTTGMSVPNGSSTTSIRFRISPSTTWVSASSPTREIKEKELNLGLDLKGGMNVMLEIQVEDVVKSLAGDSKNDPAFIEAMAQAKEGLRTGKDFIGEFVRSYRTATNGAPLAAIFVSPDRKDITPNSTDAEVEKILRKETDDAIDASFNILRSRIDHFGVTQPNIQRLPNSNRILVELPGVKEPERAQVAPRFGFARILDDLQRRRDRADADACRPGGKTISRGHEACRRGRRSLSLRLPIRPRTAA